MHGTSGYTCLYYTKSRASGNPFHVRLSDIICEPNIYHNSETPKDQSTGSLYAWQYRELQIDQTFKLKQLSKNPVKELASKRNIAVEFSTHKTCLNTFELFELINQCIPV